VILHQKSSVLDICPILYQLPAHYFALEFIFRAPNQWLTGFAAGCLLRLDRDSPRVLQGTFL